MDCWKVLFAGCVVLFATGSARAGGIDARERQAKRACMLGDTKKGVEILTDLYLDTSDATYIFNQGRCYEQNGQKRSGYPSLSGVPAQREENISRPRR
jgi:hypothetical protein